MKQISLLRENFPPPIINEPCKLNYTREALLRAVIAAGKNPESNIKTKAVRADINMRINLLLSAVDISNSRLSPTPEFLSEGSTVKSQKTFYIGNTLCAHAAYELLHIPWLVDIEVLDKTITTTKLKTNKRPDFLGQDINGQWYVFESKGRTKSPTNNELKPWKNQAQSITHVNDLKVIYNILSAAYLKKKAEWEMRWVDPPTGSDSNALYFDPFSFFVAYYQPIRDFVDQNNQKVTTAHGSLTFFPALDVYIGLHKDIITALQNYDAKTILEFAFNHYNQKIEAIANTPVNVFADGLMVAIGTSLGEIASQPQINPQNEKQKKSGTINKGKLNLNAINQSERATQNRVIQLFCQELGYRYLGDWTDRANSNIEEESLKNWLTQSGYSSAQINTALHVLREAANNPNRLLYDNNYAVYKLLRYGVPVKTDAGKPTETIHLVNWREPQKNDFAIAEEVTLKGGHERRPDIVLYLNGIAIAVLELKNSRVNIGEGIRQNLSNQLPEFNAWFFSTVQFIFAGNDSEGLQYGTIATPEKYFLKWKEDEQDDSGFKLDKYLLKLCQKDRLIELIHDFVLFDGGRKKLPRPHQYFAVHLAQQRIRENQGGIIWHTQGSGKSIVMVLLTRWILENYSDARVAIITDRDELDKQIYRIFSDVGEPIQRTRSGAELLRFLAEPAPRLLCSLIHKFRRTDNSDFEAFIHDLESNPVQTSGKIFVFVDECHRTQSGRLHRVMKAILPDAVFIGFTGTPLLKEDKQTSNEVFGEYIHTYKFSEGVADGIVLDLVYEARDIDQRLGSPDKIDAWFEAKTRGLNTWQKDQLKKQWGTMQQVLSCRARMERVVSDIIFDFSVKDRLKSERGNAILIASSIYEACKYFTLFQKTPFKGKCAVITSYNPQTRDITLEETGANTETDKQFIYNTYTDLLKDVVLNAGMSQAESYEEYAKKQFIKAPASMKLLIVVDKLLTGFDAPPCTYLYIDKSMQDHGLFQAICRVNRLDSEDKTFGYIVDYKDLFKKVEDAIQVYSSELDHSDGGVAPEVFLQERLKVGKKRLDAALEELALLCEPVEPPRGVLEHIHYFCGNTEISADLEAREPRRAALYKAVVTLIRAYANISDELEAAGYISAEITVIQKKLTDYLNLREIIRKASGETLDLKTYEADMRHLIDTYIEADEPRKISPFENIGLLELISKIGMEKTILEKLGSLKGDQTAIAETIENNVRSKIIQKQLTDPVYFAKMSALLSELITARKQKAIAYEEYLKQIATIAVDVEKGQSDSTPHSLNTPGKRALWNNLAQNEELALKLDEAVKLARLDDWRGTLPRERVIKQALYDHLKNKEEVERIFLIIYNQKEY